MIQIHMIFDGVEKLCYFGPNLEVVTLRSLLNELACLTVDTIVKRASSFNRDLRLHTVTF